MTTSEVRPHPGTPQEEALASDADVVVLGGANGGGKTWALMYAPLACVDDPHFRGVIFRRKLTDARKPGGLVDESHQWYPQLGGEYNQNEHKWTFPSGATIKFSHLKDEGEEKTWDGSQLTFIGFDQVEEFTARQFFFLASRLRSPRSKWEPFMFATCNPTPKDHWLYRFVQPWMGDQGRMPEPSQAGDRRYFYPEDNYTGFTFVDADDYQTVTFDDGTTTEVPPKSVEFHPATVKDNPTIMENEPGYVRELNTLDTVDKKRKLHGVWGVSRDDSPLSDHHIQIKDPSEIPDDLAECRYWDVADSEATPDNPDPSHTAGVRGGVVERMWAICGFGDEQGDEECTYWQSGEVDHATCPQCGKRSLQTETMKVLVVTDAVWFQLSGSTKKNRMRSVAQMDGTNVKIGVEQEPGSSGKDVARDFERNVFPEGCDVTADKPTGDKETRMSLWTPLAETGRVWLAKGDWNRGYIEALEEMDPMDVIDATSGCYKLAQDASQDNGWVMLT